MEYLRVSVSKERLKKLNDFYIHHFGYDVRTQLFNIIESEYQKIKNEPTTPQEKVPYPTIQNGNKQKKWKLLIHYPDGSKTFYSHNDYDVLIQVLNEWSKYSYDRSKKGKVLTKIVPEYDENIGIRRNRSTGKTQYWVRRKVDKPSSYNSFGKYDSVDDALLVKEFMENKNWDDKYICSNLFKKKIISNYNDYNGYMLQLAKQNRETKE